MAKKKKNKVKEPRNSHAINAHFRKAGPLKDKRKKREEDHGKQKLNELDEWVWEFSKE